MAHRGVGRPGATHLRSRHALGNAERRAVLHMANGERFSDLPPVRIVLMLADEEAPG